MLMELLLCKVNYGWHKAGSAAGFTLGLCWLIESRECIKAKREEKILYLQ